MVAFTEKDFYELSDMLDFSYENIARVANKKLQDMIDKNILKPVLPQD